MPVLLVFTVLDRPRHVGADRAMSALLGAFSFAPVVQREPHDDVVTFSAVVPDVQHPQLPAAVEALRGLDDVRGIALVTLPGPAAPAPAPEPAEATNGNGESVGRQP